MNRPVVLVILDGWGIGPSGPGNAICLAHTPTMNELLTAFPHTELTASGEAVGLPRGEDGNTETGHLNIGAGQIVYQDLPRINVSIADGSFFENAAFQNAVSHVQQNRSKLHLLGLIGSGGVHSNLEHLFALMHFAKQHETQSVYLHLITDGRDSPPNSALTYLAGIRQKIAQGGSVGKIATIMGRYWAMDRDHRWERTAKAYFALTKGIGIPSESPEAAIKISYDAGKTDEFIDPTIIVTSDHRPVALVENGDAVIFFNYRIDRPRQLTKAFVLPNFQIQALQEGFDPFAVKYYQKHISERREVTAPFERGDLLKNLYFVTMTRYEENLPVDVAFAPQFVHMPLGRVIAEQGLRQARIAETEKERFVTYYFNGYREEPFVGEDRFIIPSPMVPTFDLKPEMATPELTRLLIEKLHTKQYDFFVINVACPDMVAHTGNLEATKIACEATDVFLKSAVSETLALDGVVVVTGDHGNAEELIDPMTGQKDTEHSTAPVPFIIVSNKLRGSTQKLQPGILADIAPTILRLMEIEQPQEMSGRSLF